MAHKPAMGRARRLGIGYRKSRWLQMAQPGNELVPDCRIFSYSAGLGRFVAMNRCPIAGFLAGTSEIQKESDQ